MSHGKKAAAQAVLLIAGIAMVCFGVWRGEAETVGLSYGYMFPIARRLSLEAGLGLGYLHSKYEEYEPVPHMGGTHYVYLQTKRVDYFGPLKLKLALIWHLQDINRKKGGAQ